jgi:hypothetical protein
VDLSRSLGRMSDDSHHPRLQRLAVSSHDHSRDPHHKLCVGDASPASDLEANLCGVIEQGRILGYYDWQILTQVLHD